MSGWIYLGFAILCEAGATSVMKYASMSGKNIFLLVFALCMASSFYLMFRALKSIDLSIAYAIWAGAGVFLVACIGFIVFKDPFSWLKVLFLGFVLVGVVGLKLLA